MTDPNITVYSDYLTFKFFQSVMANTITNGHFRVFTDVATPVEILNPFQAINMPNDFDPIGRRVTLYFNYDFAPNTSYLLEVSGLTDVANRSIPSATFHFTTLDIVDQFSSATPDITTVTDRSVISDVILSPQNLIEQQNPNFYVVGTDPEGPIIDTDQNAGRITLKFSTAPSANFLTSQYFKAQRKLIDRGMTRWENLNVNISLDSVNPWVYIDFPSLDATPVYGVVGSDYFQTRYKYRVKVSREVGT